jgi:hypothetical protein
MDAVDKCAIEIASLNAMALHKAHKIGNGKKCNVPWGTFEEVVLEVCEK